MIGIFDSGVGGLTIVKEVFKTLPEYQIIYFGDTARLPYGTKQENFVKEYSAKISQWLIEKQAKIIVVACHTSSAWAAESLKRKLKVPVFEMITPVVKEILNNNYKKIGIIGTPGTIKSNCYNKRLLKNNSSLRIYSQACPLLVPLVEEGWIDKKETELITQHYLKPLKEKKVDCLVLACTHYPLLEKTIKKIMGKKVKIINPAESLVQDLKKFLEEDNLAKKGSNHQFFFSDNPYHLDKLSKMALNKKIKIKIERLGC